MCELCMIGPAVTIRYGSENVLMEILNDSELKLTQQQRRELENMWRARRNRNKSSM